MHGQGPHPCCRVSADELCGVRRRWKELGAPAACGGQSLRKARASFEIAEGDRYYDASVSGADSIEGRVGSLGSSTASKVMASARSSSRMPAVLHATGLCRSWALPC